MLRPLPKRTYLFLPCRPHRHGLMKIKLDENLPVDLAGTHHGVLLVRLVNPSREALVERIVTVFQTEDVTGWAGCNVVVTNQKARVRTSTS